MLMGYKLNNNDDSHRTMKTKYRFMIGGLQCLTYTRPHIASAVGIVVRCQEDPKEITSSISKKNSQILKGNFKTWFMIRLIKWFDIYTYIEVGWIGNIDYRRSTSGGTFFSWRKIGFMVEQATRLHITIYNRQIMCSSRKSL